MNHYYHELALVVYDRFGIDPYEKVIYRNYYLTVQDYLIGVSIDDKIKNIMALMKTLPEKDDVMEFINAAISHIIRETLLENDRFAHYYKYRLKEITKII